MVDFGPLMAEIGLPVRAPQQISTGFSSWLRYCTDVAQWSNGGQPNFARCLAVSWAGTLYSNGILPSAKFSLRPSLACCYDCVLFFNVYVLPFGVINDDADSLWTALLHGTRAVGVSQTLWRGIFTRHSGHHPVRHWAVALSSFFLNVIYWTKHHRSYSQHVAEHINTSVVSAGQPMSVRPPVTDSLSSWSSSWLNTTSDRSAYWCRHHTVAVQHLSVSMCTLRTS